MKLLFITNVPSPYRVLFFNELGKHCELTVLYQKGSSNERNSKWKETISDNYQSVFLKGVSTGVDKAFCPEVIKYLRKEFDYVVICGISSPTEMLAIEWCKICKIPYCLEGDGAFLYSEKKIKYLFKRHLIHKAKLCFSTCRNLDKYYMHYGVGKSRIKRYSFTSLLEKDILKCPLTITEKKQIRDNLDISEKIVLLAVGRFIYCKGFDILLKSLRKINNIGVYIVGDEPTEGYLKIIEKYNIHNVHFVGFKTKLELQEYYKASDFFVLPTRGDVWGLVINEAMAYGLPVITTNRCNAGLELIKNGYNGYIVKVEDIDSLEIAINRISENYVEMGRNALATIRDYTIETMAKDHIRVLSKKSN